MDETVQKVSDKQSLFISSIGIILIKSEEPCKNVAAIQVPILAKIYDSILKNIHYKSTAAVPLTRGALNKHKINEKHVKLLVSRLSVMLTSLPSDKWSAPCSKTNAGVTVSLWI
jgi:hypothetical protein